MKLTIQLVDEDYERYAEHAATTPGSPSAEELIAAQVARFKEVRPSDRIIVVDSRHRSRLEDLLPSGGSLRDAADLVARVDRVARVEVGGIKVPFTVQELEELSYRARGQNRPVADLIAEAVAAWHEQFFNWPDARPCPECARRAAPPVRVAPPPAVLEEKVELGAMDIAAARSAEARPPVRPIPPPVPRISGGAIKGQA